VAALASGLGVWEVRGRRDARDRAVDDVAQGDVHEREGREVVPEVRHRHLQRLTINKSPATRGSHRVQCLCVELPDLVMSELIGELQHWTGEMSYSTIHECSRSWASFGDVHEREVRES